LKKLEKYMKDNPGYIFKVPNTKEGDLFRSLAKKFLSKTYRFRRRGQDGKHIHQVPMHRYYLQYKDLNNDLKQLNASQHEYLRREVGRVYQELRVMRGAVTRNLIKELKRVCSDDEDLSGIAEKLERLYVAKTLLGEEG